MSWEGPDLWERVGRSIGERTNPIVVKEVRQGLRTRTFWVFFSLMLVVCLAISLVGFATVDPGGQTGRSAFLACFFVLSVVQFFVIPYTAYRSMSREQEDETWVLLTLTGIGPRRILRGKIGSLVMQGLLYASASAPFLVFSYYLNGIDLPTIALAGVLGGIFHVFLVSLAVSAATLASTRVARAAVHFLVLGFLVQALIGGLTGAAGIIDARLLSSGLSVVWLSVGFGMLSTALLMFEAAASRLSLTTESYARGPRLAFLLQFFGGVGFFVWAFLDSGDAKVLLVGSVLSSLYALLVGSYIGADRDGMARNHWVKRGAFKWLQPGAYRGFGLLAVATITMAGVFIAAVVAREPGIDEQGFGVLAAAPGFALLYLALPHVVARLIPHPTAQTPAMVRLLTLGLFVLGAGVPPLIAEFITEADDVRFNLLNPVVGLVNLGRERGAIGNVLWVWGAALVVTALAFVLLRRRDTLEVTQ